jgi:hypothetical protein
MRSIVSTFALAGVFLCAATTYAAAQIAASDTVSTVGVGPVKFGMTLAQAQAAGVTLATTGADSGPGCYFVRPAAPAGLLFMLRDGKIVRADLAKPAVLKTADGFGLGDKEGPILGFYAATKGGVSDFAPSGGSDLSVLAAPEFSAGDDVPRIVYEVEDDAGVAAIHAGWVPRHFDGCAK